jgi:tetratricopeptide (TPR) repeat protein
MKKIILRSVISLMVIAIAACSTGKKAFQEGDYYNAVLKAVERLRDNPQSKKSVETLKQAYPLAVSTAKDEIDQLLRSQDPFRYSGVVERYEKMNKMADEIRHCPAALDVVKNPDFFGEQLAAARQKAAPEAYDAGVSLLNKGSRESAKEAYYQFLNADRFVPGFRDVKKMIENARFDATLKVIVEQIPVPGRYKISSDFFFDQVYSFLAKGMRQEFVEFYDPASAKNLPYADEILVMQFDDFIVGATNDKESEKEYISKDSVKVGTTKVNGQTIDVFNKVKAKLTTHRREVISTGILAVQIVDAKTNKPKAAQKFPGTFTWVTEWANFNGDERALTPQQLELCKKKPLLPPPPQDLFLEFTKPIFEQLKGFLRNYYRNS